VFLAAPCITLVVIIVVRMGKWYGRDGCEQGNGKHLQYGFVVLGHGSSPYFLTVSR
jgi:hypothetical protein